MTTTAAGRIEYTGPVVRVGRLAGSADTGTWQQFGVEVLRAHHRYRNTQQCACGQLLDYCPVLAAARQVGLPTEDPNSPTPSRACRGSG